MLIITIKIITKLIIITITIKSKIIKTRKIMVEIDVLQKI